MHAGEVEGWGEVEMTVKVEVTAGAGRRMTLEDTRLRKQTL